MFGSEYLDTSIRIAAATVPVGVYFLILGLLNTRRHPQLLSGRQDFVLLITALSPLFLVPALEYVGTSPGSIAAVGATLIGLVAILAPPKGTWVIYNIQPGEARNAVGRVLKRLAEDFQPAEDGFRLGGKKAIIQIGGFPLLRNVSVRLRGAEEDLASRFEGALAETLSAGHAQTSPMAVALLLVATGMMAAPLMLIAHRVPEIVRLLSDML